MQPIDFTPIAERLRAVISPETPTEGLLAQIGSGDAETQMTNVCSLMKGRPLAEQAHVMEVICRKLPSEAARQLMHTKAFYAWCDSNARGFVQLYDEGGLAEVRARFDNPPG